jgi:hypothetical protein
MVGHQIKRARHVAIRNRLMPLFPTTVRSVPGRGKHFHTPYKSNNEANTTKGRAELNQPVLAGFNPAPNLPAKDCDSIVALSVASAAASSGKTEIPGIGSVTYRFVVLSAKMFMALPACSKAPQKKITNKPRI